MNIWTEKSIELANQSNYLDLLYEVYPMPSNLHRKISEKDKKEIEDAFNNKDNKRLLKLLLSQPIFPIKDSYVSYLKKDSSAIDRNPNTVNRLIGMIYDMGLEEIFEKLTTPKETNRQIGPLFKKWLERGSLGCGSTTDEDDFLNSKTNTLFLGSDAAMENFATKHLGYNREKGLDFIAKFNDTYVLAETKFLTDIGGHQNAQYADAIATMKTQLTNTGYKVKIISILDGVLYIKSKNKMYRNLISDFRDDEVIISAILLRDYLHSI